MYAEGFLTRGRDKDVELVKKALAVRNFAAETATASYFKFVCECVQLVAMAPVSANDQFKYYPSMLEPATGIYKTIDALYRMQSRQSTDSHFCRCLVSYGWTGYIYARVNNAAIFAFARFNVLNIPVAQ
jgi:hypothetical protein